MDNPHAAILGLAGWADLLAQRMRAEAATVATNRSTEWTGPAATAQSDRADELRSQLQCASEELGNVAETLRNHAVVASARHEELMEQLQAGAKLLGEVLVQTQFPGPIILSVMPRD